MYTLLNIQINQESVGSPQVFGGVRVAHFFSFLWGFFLCLSSSCVLCTHCYQCLWVVHSSFPLRCSLVFIYTILKISGHEVLSEKEICHWVNAWYYLWGISLEKLLTQISVFSTPPYGEISYT